MESALCRGLSEHVSSSAHADIQGLFDASCRKCSLRSGPDLKSHFLKETLSISCTIRDCGHAYSMPRLQATGLVEQSSTEIPRMRDGTKSFPKLGKTAMIQRTPFFKHRCEFLKRWKFLEMSYSSCERKYLKVSHSVLVLSILLVFLSCFDTVTIPSLSTVSYKPSSFKA